jgi:hypothetical protein
VLLRPVGFWTERPGDGLPDPRRLMSTSWETARRGFIAGYLMTGSVLEEVESHACLVCGAAAGHRERTDGFWRWPEGLAHYVTAHGVRLPDELVQHMAKHSFTAPRVDVRELRDQVPTGKISKTALISKSRVAEELGEMLGEPKKDKPRENDKNAALDDETAAIPVVQAWQALVQGVPTKPQRIVFDRPIVLGRDRTCDVVLEHKSVSRRHARLVPWKDRVIVQDLGSSNGIWLRQKRRDGQVELGEGEQFSLGQATITVVRAGANNS